MKKVSVILTTYNSEPLIQRVLNSMFSQQGRGSEFELEIIVVDDCSRDGTPDILKRNGVIFLSTAQNSGGPNKGRNIGLGIATGDFICIADHDDEWKKNKIISLLPLFEIAPIVTSGYTVISTQNDQEIERFERVPKRKNKEQEINVYKTNETFLGKLSRSKKGQQTYLGSIMYEASLKNILFEEKYGMVDFDWILRLFYNRDSVELCQSLYYRYVEKANLSLNENYRLKDFDYSYSAMENFKKEFPRHVEIGKKRLHGSLARYYYLFDKMKVARGHFLKSEWELKTLLYYLTTFFGAEYVKKNFKVFG